MSLFFKNIFTLKTVLVLLFPLQLFAQDLTGKWTGSIRTTDKTLPYEIVITNNNGKLVGYSYTTFNVKGEEMVAMKSITLTNENGKVIIDDDNLMYDNFDDAAPKQLKQTSTMVLKTEGKSMFLDGKFKTKKTAQFRSMGGDISLRKDSIIDQSRLIVKLDEMDLYNTLSFVKPNLESAQDLAVITKVVTTAEAPAEIKKETVSPIVTAPATAARPEIKPIKKAEVVTTKAASPPPAKPVAVVPPPPAPVKKTTAVVVPAKTVSKPVAVAKPAPAPVTKPIAPPATPPVAKKAEVAKAPVPFATTFGRREIETIQTITFKTDSLVLTLYDNGYVDGDTVSVIVNGKMIMEKQGLSTNPITKTIYITPDMGDSLQMIMYAENLGSIAPNTGLLIVKDGRDRYEVRFAGDLTKNAAVIFRRRVK